MPYSPEQRRMIGLANELSRGYSDRVRRSLLAAMLVESGARNLNYGDRDSQGVLQQRPSQGWGAPGNPAEDIRQYLERAAQTDRGFRGTPGQLAQAIQRSAFPERYDQRLAEATRLLGIQASVPSLRRPVSAPTAAPSGPLANPAALNLYNQNLALVGLPALPPMPAASSPPPADGPTLLPPRKTGAAPKGQGLKFLLKFAEPFNLTVTSTTGGKHVKGSWHYKRRGADFGGDPAEMEALARAALNHPERFKEMFYDPIGMYIKNGRVYKGAIGGHGDHIHLAA